MTSPETPPGGAPDQSMKKQNPARTETAPSLAREIWFREDEEQEIAARRLTATVRSGDRREGTSDPKGGYKEGGFVALRIELGKGVFRESETAAVVSAVSMKKFKELTEEDLLGTLFRTRAELRKRLAALYGRAFSDEDDVSIVRFEYRDNLKEASDLVRVGSLSFAKRPENNPDHFDFPSYTVPLIEHDYPAKTPIMWNAAYRELGIPEGNVMLIGDPKESRHILEVLGRDGKYKGGGAGVGFKDEVVAHLDEIDPEAEAVGAVNFILKTPEGKLKGYNTDGAGYAESLGAALQKRGEELRGKKAVLLGAGGTGNAIAFALARKGARVVILNRTVRTAEELADKINAHFGKNGTDEARFGGEEQITAEIADADAVINVSTKGAAGALERYSALAPARLPATDEHVAENLAEAERALRAIPRGAIVSDIVLGAKPTPLLEAAKRSGFETLDGVPMVVNQGVEAFWLLHGADLEARGIAKERVAEIMRRAAS